MIKEYNLWTGTKGGTEGGRGSAGRRGIKGGKRDNCNSIINKIYIFKKFERDIKKELNFSF